MQWPRPTSPQPKLHSKLTNHPQYRPYPKTKQYTQRNQHHLKNTRSITYSLNTTPHLPPKRLDPSKPNLHLNYKRYSRNKMASAYRPRHKTKCIHNLTQNLKHHPTPHRPHPNPKYQPKLKYQLELNPRSKHKYYSKHTMASVYRPHHTNDNIYHIIHNWRHNSVTNHITTNSIRMHFSPK